MTQVEQIKELVAKNADTTVALAKEIWGYAELSYEEFRSSSALVEALKEQGFEIEEGIAGMPTAFKASFKNGSGKPVIGFLAEYDALSGLSQKAACPKQEAIEPGCPAEEGAGSKQFIARAGYFDDVDFAYTWHPATVNEVGSKGSVAIMGANFIFDGVAAHAGGAPHLGRSALDAVELMNVGANYLREHMIDAARIHYAYSDPGGTAPNVVQSHAVIKYEVRAPKVNQVQELFTRLVDVAKGAALMTGTKMQYEITMAFSDYVPNRTLGVLMDECMRELGAPEWTEEEYSLATEFLRTYNRSTMLGIRESLEEYFTPDEMDKALQKPLDNVIHPFNPKETGYSSGSTDVGDVGYATPTVMIHVATACLGNVGHSWQNTAFSCSDIGMKGMLRAAEMLCLGALRTLEQPELIDKAKEELKRKNGGGYSCPLPDYVEPPIGKY